jgi:hypothetical protein
MLRIGQKVRLAVMYAVLFFCKEKEDRKGFRPRWALLAEIRGPSFSFLFSRTNQVVLVRERERDATTISCTRVDLNLVHVEPTSCRSTPGAGFDSGRGTDATQPKAYVALRAVAGAPNAGRVYFRYFGLTNLKPHPPADVVVQNNRKPLVIFSPKSRRWTMALEPQWPAAAARFSIPKSRRWTGHWSFLAGDAVAQIERHRRSIFWVSMMPTTLQRVH